MGGWHCSGLEKVVARTVALSKDQWVGALPWWTSKLKQLSVTAKKGWTREPPKGFLCSRIQWQTTGMNVINGILAVEGVSGMSCINSEGVWWFYSSLIKFCANNWIVQYQTKELLNWIKLCRNCCYSCGDKIKPINVDTWIQGNLILFLKE